MKSIAPMSMRWATASARLAVFLASATPLLPTAKALQPSLSPRISLITAATASAVSAIAAAPSSPSFMLAMIVVLMSFEKDTRSEDSESLTPNSKILALTPLEPTSTPQ